MTKAFPVVLVVASLGLFFSQETGRAVTGESAASNVVWELQRARDYRGPVRRGSVNSSGSEAYLATRATLYQVARGRTRVVAERPEEEAQLLLAPGGEVYSWLVPRPDWKGLFFVRLMDISGKQLAELQLKDFPYGFGALYLGYQGHLIVTSSPLDDWQGLSGRFQYTFWNREGSILGQHVLEGPRSGVIEPEGASFALLGEKEAIAFSASGDELWRLKGHFRKAALARNGQLALLNPADLKAIDQVLIFGVSPEPRMVPVPTPVHRLALSPDGSQAVVTGSAGRYFRLDPKTGELTEGPPLPFDGFFTILDVEIVDGDRIALAVQHRSGKPPRHTWPTGSIIVVDRAGHVSFQRSLPIREPIASVPAIDMTFGSRFFIGLTEDTTILAGLGPLRPGR